MDGLLDWGKNTRESTVKKYMGQGYSKDFSLILFGFAWTRMARKLNSWPEDGFLNFAFDQIEMVRKEDPSRANVIDKDLLVFLEKHSTNKVWKRLQFQRRVS